LSDLSTNSVADIYEDYEDVGGAKEAG